MEYQESRAEGGSRGAGFVDEEFAKRGENAREDNWQDQKDFPTNC